MKYIKKMSVKEWKKFNKPKSAETFGNDVQFRNHLVRLHKNGSHSIGMLESQEFLTGQEILLYKYRIILTDHKSKHDGKFVKVPLKEKLKGGLKQIPGKITQANFDKGMKTFDEGMQSFSKEMDSLTKGLGGDKKSNKKNLDSLWGPKKNSVDIWGKKKKTPKKRKPKKKSSSKSKDWDQHEKNLEKLWGKK